MVCWSWRNQYLPYRARRVPLVQDIIRGTFLFSIEIENRLVKDDVVRNRLYMPGDGTYPGWPIFAEDIHHPADESEHMYTKRQESIRKDI